MHDLTHSGSPTITGWLNVWAAGCIARDAAIELAAQQAIVALRPSTEEWYDVLRMGLAIEKDQTELERIALRETRSADGHPEHDPTVQLKTADQPSTDALLEHLRLECQLLNAIPDDDEEEEVQVWCALMDVMVGAIEGEPRESAMITLRDTDLHFMTLWEMIQSFVEEADNDEEKEARIHALDSHLQPFLMRVFAQAHSFREYKYLLYYWPVLRVQRRLCLTASLPKEWVFIWRHVPETRMKALALGRLLQLTTD
jgi:hypothetical protein